MNQMQEMQNKTEKRKENLDEVFLIKGRGTNTQGTNAKLRNTRELHLELGGDKVTYVRVY